MMERDKVTNIEEFRTKRKQENCNEISRYIQELDKIGYWKDNKTQSSRRTIETLVKEIETDEFTVFKERKRLKILYFRGEYDIDEDNG